MPSNVAVLSFYLFGPFWALYFIIGIVLAFLYDAYRPAERHNLYIWGWIADSITLIMIGLSIAMICQPIQYYGEEPVPLYMRPSYMQTNSLITRHPTDYGIMSLVALWLR